MNNKPKIIIIGAGLAGSVMARLFAEDNYLVEIYEKNNHIAGNLYDYYDEHGILIHKYGPHIFHTNEQKVWDFITRFSSFETYTNKVLVNVNDTFVPLPINLDSIKLLFPHEYEDFEHELLTYFKLNTSVSILDLKKHLKSDNALNITNFIFDNIYKNYSMKMWGLTCNQLDPNLFSRVKINIDHEWNYFPNDKYQAIPQQGYTALINNLITHKNIKLNLNFDAMQKISFNNNKILFNNDEKVIVIYTGKLDCLFNYKYDKLPYRSLNIVFEHHDIDSYQPTAVINYPSHKTMTRITEYKKLTNQIKHNSTTISKEYPGAYDEASSIFNVPFYPINTNDTKNIKEKYLSLSKKYDNLCLVGRLAEYRYYDMDDVIARCLELYEIFKNYNHF